MRCGTEGLAAGLAARDSQETSATAQRASRETRRTATAQAVCLFIRLLNEFTVSLSNPWCHLAVHFTLGSSQLTSRAATGSPRFTSNAARRPQCLYDDSILSSQRRESS